VLRNSRIWLALSLLLVIIPTAGCVPQAQKFIVVASGDPMEGPAQGQVFTIALRSAAGGQPVPIIGPEEATKVLDMVNADPGLGLFFYIYGGEQPSAGYSVQIRSIVYSYGDGRGKYTVRWTLKGPVAGDGAAAVLTHPYILARITNKSVPVANVEFIRVRE
jgi:hypothetical protein